MYHLEFQDIAIRLAVAVIAGGVVGFEREKKGRNAGFRTHILVAVGSCIFGLIELETAFSVLALAGANDIARQVVTFDLHRLTAQVVSGIGFLGAGTIIISKRSIKGLTTAASIWVCAALGMAAGFGYYRVVLAGSVVIMLTLLVVKRVFFFPKIKGLSIHFIGQEKLQEEIIRYLKNNRFKVMEIDSEVYIENDLVHHKLNLHLDARLLSSTDEFLRHIKNLGDIEQVSLRDLGDEYL